MPPRPTRLLLTGLASLSLTGCAPRLVLLETCPPIPANLTEPCAVPDRDIATNGDLARAYIDATECVEESRIKLEAVRALGECRVKALASTSAEARTAAGSPRRR